VKQCADVPAVRYGQMWNLHYPFTNIRLYGFSGTDRSDKAVHYTVHLHIKYSENGFTLGKDYSMGGSPQSHRLRYESQNTQTPPPRVSVEDQERETAASSAF
jgi:hypothetical protein